MMTKKVFPVVIAIIFVTAMFSTVVRAADFSVLLGLWEITLKGTILGDKFESHPLWRFTEASGNAATGFSSVGSDEILLATWSTSKGQYCITKGGGSSYHYYVSVIGNSMIGTFEGTYVSLKFPFQESINIL